MFLIWLLSIYGEIDALKNENKLLQEDVTGHAIRSRLGESLRNKLGKLVAIDASIAGGLASLEKDFPELPSDLRELIDNTFARWEDEVNDILFYLSTQQKVLSFVPNGQASRYQGIQHAHVQDTLSESICRMQRGYEELGYAVQTFTQQRLDVTETHKATALKVLDLAKWYVEEIERMSHE